MLSKLLRVVCPLFLTVLLTTASGCKVGDEKAKKVESGKPVVITTLFPIYDFARNIAGGRADVQLLLPPGVEPHNFEPRPEDLVRIGKADLFIYTNPHMEPWADKIIKSVDGGKIRIVNSGAGIKYLSSASGRGHDDHGHEAQGGHGHASKYDPHIWLDLGNAAKMTDNILAGLIAADPANQKYYTDNAAVFKDKLAALDKRFSDGLAVCGTRKIFHGGHFAFGYLAGRYGLDYHSISGVSSESEPSAARMAAMVRQIKRSGTRFIFAEELVSPRISETLAAEAGVTVLKLHGAHNLGRDDFQRGLSFISLMDENLVNLQKGMACRAK